MTKVHNVSICERCCRIDETGVGELGKLESGWSKVLPDGWAEMIISGDVPVTLCSECADSLGETLKSWFIKGRSK